MPKRKRQPKQAVLGAVVPGAVIPTQSDLAGLAAGDAEVFDCMAAAKRASAVSADPV